MDGDGEEPDVQPVGDAEGRQRLGDVLQAARQGLQCVSGVRVVFAAIPGTRDGGRAQHRQLHSVVQDVRIHVLARVSRKEGRKWFI